VVTLPDGRRLEGLQVGAGIRLGHRNGGHELARGQLRNPGGLLLRRAVGAQIVRHTTLDHHTEGDTGAGQLLEHDSLVPEIAAPAANVFRKVGQQHAELAGLPPGLAVGAMLGPPPFLCRYELLVNELANRAAVELQIVGDPGTYVGGQISQPFPDELQAGRLDSPVEHPQVAMTLPSDAGLRACRPCHLRLISGRSAHQPLELGRQ
jgi:hypothetical protein